MFVKAVWDERFLLNIVACDEDIVCNIPVNDVYNKCKLLPRPADRTGLLVVKLKP